MTSTGNFSRLAVLPAVMLSAVALLVAPAGASGDDLTTQVNPLAGSLGGGFPMVGASVPFAMIEPGPDTALANGSQNPVNYDGYGYEDPTIRGFSLTHFDGAGVPIAGDLPFMPTTGSVSAPGADQLGDASPFEHAGEVSQPGYYAATLDRYQTRTELTATKRATMMRITYPSTGQANLLAEVGQSIHGPNDASVTVVGDRHLQGWVRSDVGYRVYFAASFDEPFTAYGTWTGSTLSAGTRQSSGRGTGSFLTFNASRRRTVTMRVAISYVDQRGALKNLARELPASLHFDTVRKHAHDAWNARLHDVQASGAVDPALSPTFYTNLYRSMLMPQLFDDGDGRYLGLDGGVRRVAPGHHHYTALSLWDTYRSQSPMLALLEPTLMHDVLISMLDDYDQGHQVVPRWVQANIDRGIMAGDSGSVTLADGVMAGVLKGADARRALAALIHQAFTLPSASPRDHLDAYLKYGYVPQNVDDISASLTLEYARDDQAVAQVARHLGDSSDAQALDKRAGYWRNLMDPGTHAIRPRNSDGSWATPSGAAGPVPVPTGSLPYRPELEGGYQEETGWQNTWGVPHDVAGLAGAMGGQPTAIRRLDVFFSTALNQPLVPVVPAVQSETSFFGVYYVGNQYTPANEPDLWTPWYYDWLGQPWKTQKVVRAEMSVYNARPDGLPGNDDTGEMSAWYVLAALGIYHVAPGVDAYEINGPAFPRMIVREGRHRLVIDAPSASALKPYINSAQLNGQALNRSYLTTCELTHGGALSFTVAAVAHSTWATAPGMAPPSQSDASPNTTVDACAAQSVRVSPAARQPRR